MKDYLKESLSSDEKAFIYGIIRKTALKFVREYVKVEQKEILCLDSDDMPEDLLIDYNSSNLVDKILETEILRGNADLKSYSQNEKEEIVKTLENLAIESGLKEFIAPLTFNEKLVVFLIYVEHYDINTVAILLDINRSTIWRRDKSIKKKILKVKEKISNGRS